MSSEYSKIRIEGAGEVRSGKRLPLGHELTNTATDFPYIRLVDVSNGRVQKQRLQFLKPETRGAIRRYVVNTGDVCLAIVGHTIGMVFYIDSDFDDVNLTENAARITAVNDFLNSKYLYYYLISPIGQAEIQARKVGSAQGKLPLYNIKSLEIKIPPKYAQDEIVRILETLDDRITLLRETNATLEAIAQALFKSWFVDFDPVRAKAEGLEPQAMDATTAALFPDSFEESELGLVPKGWSITSVADVAEVIKGKSYTSKELAASHHTALVTLKSFARGGGFRLDGFKPYTGSYKPAQVVVPGDLIIAYTDVTQAAELIGKPAIVVGVENYQTLVASLDVGIVRPSPKKVSRQYLYGLFRTELFQSHTFAHTSGTTVLHMAKDGVGSYQFPCPPQELVRLFSAVSDALSERCQNNIDQVRTLTQLRDTLLPRLISGQLRLPEAESLLEKAL